MSTADGLLRQGVAQPVDFRDNRGSKGSGILDDSVLRLVYVLTDLIAPLAVGYWLKERQLASEKNINWMIKLNVRLVYTMLSLLSFWVLPLSWDLALIPLYGFLFILFPGALGVVLGRRFKNLLVRGSYIASAMLANIGTLGGVCAFILYNETGFAYAQLIGTCQNIMLVLLVFPMSQYFYLKQNRLPIRQGSRLHSFMKMFFSWNQLSLLGMMAGLALQGLGVERPAELAPFFQSLVHIGAWTAMMPVGYLMDFGRAKHYLRYTIDLCAIRFFLVPAFIFFSSRLVFRDPVLLNTFIILASTPTAINAVLASKLYQLRTDLAVCSFILTTAIYLLVVFPLLFYLLV